VASVDPLTLPEQLLDLRDVGLGDRKVLVEAALTLL
jgi:hypothetical protein